MIQIREKVLRDFDIELPWFIRSYAKNENTSQYIHVERVGLKIKMTTIRELHYHEGFDIQVRYFRPGEIIDEDDFGRSAGNSGPDPKEDFYRVLSRIKESVKEIE